MQGPESTFRPVARVLLLDPADRVLLSRWEVGDETWWTAPGGGVDAWETHEEAAVRELEEEIGLVGISLGPPVWTREHVFEWKERTLHQQERFFMCRVPAFDVDSLQPAGPQAAEEVGHRWWSVDEIRNSQEEFSLPAASPTSCKTSSRMESRQHP